MAFLNKEIADALCTVITLGYAGQMQANGNPLTFEHEANDKDAADNHEVQIAFGNLGVQIHVSQSAPQHVMPYILGTQPFGVDAEPNFLQNLENWANDINNMFLAANAQNPQPRGAYIGVQFVVEGLGDIVGDPLIYGPSSLSLHMPIYRSITPLEAQEIGVAYYNARMSTNNAVRAVTNGLHVQPLPNFDTDYLAGHIFGSGHGMIRAMVNHVHAPPPNCDSVFAELALGAGTRKVSSCVPCAIFMQSFGYPASSIHLGRGDNWRIPDNPQNSVLNDWINCIVACYISGLEVFNPRVNLENNRTTLDNAAAMIIASNRDVNDIMPEIPNLFLEALTFEGSFTDRITDTFARQV
jgi:hypothetical protein